MRQKLFFLLAAILLLSALAAGAAHAQTGSGFDLSWHVIGYGGGEMSGSSFTIRGTLGQTAVHRAYAGAFDFQAGFWNPWVAPLRVFLPIVLRNFSPSRR